MVPVPISATALRLRAWRRWPSSKSAPIWNIRKTSPTWLMIESGRGEVLPNRAWLSPGNRWPRTEGPRTSPATISPTAPGWPSRRASMFSPRAARMMMTSCTSVMTRTSSVWWTDVVATLLILCLLRGAA